MGLRVVATFSSLVEAQVARGALLAAGFDAQLFDQVFGSVMWVDQVAIGGFRMVVPDAEAADAMACLSEIRREAPRARTRRHDGDAAWSFVALASAIFLSPAFGWLVVGARRSGRRRWRPIAVGFVLSCLIVAAAFALTVLASAIGLGWLSYARGDQA